MRTNGKKKESPADTLFGVAQQVGREDGLHVRAKPQLPGAGDAAARHRHAQHVAPLHRAPRRHLLVATAAQRLLRRRLLLRRRFGFLHQRRPHLR